MNWLQFSGSGNVISSSGGTTNFWVLGGANLSPVSTSYIILGGFSTSDASPGTGGFVSSGAFICATASANASTTQISVGSGISSLTAGRSGTGTYLPLTFNVNGGEQLRVLTTGSLLLHHTSDDGSGMAFQNQGGISLTGNTGGNYLGRIWINTDTSQGQSAGSPGVAGPGTDNTAIDNNGFEGNFFRVKTHLDYFDWTSWNPFLANGPIASHLLQLRDSSSMSLMSYYAGGGTNTEVTYTDLVINGVNNKEVSSASNPFNYWDIGKTVVITGGTGFTLGSYPIIQVDSSHNAYFNSAVGTAGSTGGTGSKTAPNGAFYFTGFLETTPGNGACFGQDNDGSGYLVQVNGGIEMTSTSSNILSKGTSTNAIFANAGGLASSTAIYLNANGSTPANPGGGTAGYGGLAYHTGSIYYYWNGTSWATADLSAVGSGYWTESSGLLYPTHNADKVLVNRSTDDTSGASLQVNGIISTSAGNGLLIGTATNSGSGYLAQIVGGVEIRGTGNSLYFSATGQRILGDFTNGTASNRVLLQTTTINSSTIVGAIPNGTSVTSGFQTYNNSDPNNAGNAQFGVSGGIARFVTNFTGTGSAPPVYIQPAVVTTAVFLTTGRSLFGGATADDGSGAWVQIPGTSTQGSINAGGLIQSYATGTALAFQANSGTFIVNGAGAMSLVGPISVSNASGGVLNIIQALSTASTTGSQTYMNIGQALSTSRAANFGFVDNTDAVNGTLFLGLHGDNPATGAGLLIKRGSYVGIGVTPTSGGAYLQVAGSFPTTTSISANGQITSPLFNSTATGSNLAFQANGGAGGQWQANGLLGIANLNIFTGGTVQWNGTPYIQVSGGNLQGWNGSSWVNLIGGASGVISVTGSTGVTVSPTTGAVVVSIGQAVATSSNVTFNQVTASTQFIANTANSGALNSFSNSQMQILGNGNINTNGTINSVSGFYINGTVVINSTRDLGNIGAISAVGNVSITGASATVSVGNGTGASYFFANTANSVSYNSFANNQMQILGNGNILTNGTVNAVGAYYSNGNLGTGVTSGAASEFVTTSAGSRPVRGGLICQT